MLRFATLLLVTGGMSLSAGDFVFSDGEIRVDFRQRFSVAPSAKGIPYGDYLAKPLQLIEFCPFQPQDPEVQQVGPSESGFLCELYKMPLENAETALELVQNASKVKRKDHGIFRNVEVVKLRDLKVVRWRFQVGKTRLDHFLVIGKKHNYLFVSSAYGSNGSIEEILARTTLK